MLLHFHQVNQGWCIPRNVKVVWVFKSREILIQHFLESDYEDLGQKRITCDDMLFYKIWGSINNHLYWILLFYEDLVNESGARFSQVSLRKSNVEAGGIPPLGMLLLCVCVQGNGSFWYEIWCGETCLKDHFPDLLDLESNKNALAAPCLGGMNDSRVRH